MVLLRDTETYIDSNSNKRSVIDITCYVPMQEPESYAASIPKKYRYVNHTQYRSWLRSIRDSHNIDFRTVKKSKSVNEYETKFKSFYSIVGHGSSWRCLLVIPNQDSRTGTYENSHHNSFHDAIQHILTKPENYDFEVLMDNVHEIYAYDSESFVAAALKYS